MFFALLTSPLIITISKQTSTINIQLPTNSQNFNLVGLQWAQYSQLFPIRKNASIEADYSHVTALIGTLLYHTKETAKMMKHLD